MICLDVIGMIDLGILFLNDVAHIMNAQRLWWILFCRAAANLMLVALFTAAASAQEVLWLEAEAHRALSGRAQLIDGTAPDHGALARTGASGGQFVRIMPGAKVVLGPALVEQAGARAVWVRAFPMTGRRVTVAVNGRVVGSTSGGAKMVALVWQRVGSARLAKGKNEVELRAAADNDNDAYVDCVALLRDDNLAPAGRSPAEIIRMNRIARLDEEFAGQSLRSVAERWTIRPPPGADAVVEVLRKQEGGALRIHNGSAGSFMLTSREPLDVKPGDQLTVRVRMRKSSLIEHITVSVPGVGTFAPQLYREFHTAEQTWLVPPGATGPILVQLVGAGGGDTYISRIEAFRQDPPLSPFVTGRFLPPPDLRREGRLFEIERYVVNTDAFTEADVDGDKRWSLCRLSREKNRPYFSRGTVLKSDSVPADRATPDEGCPTLRVRVGPLEPGRYQVYLSVPGRALAYSRDGKQWRRLPGADLPDLGVATMTEPFFEFWLDDRYAELANPGPAYVDFIRFLPIPEPAAVFAPAPAPQPPGRGSVGRRAVTLTIENPADPP
ncbi:MAG: hypothetical protein FJ388_14125, partial [Verrucomicrobia bacterium]|nr:hypothetical protein [Verrucomicrobiota bacterium]